MAFDPEKERYNFETAAYLEAENLRFKASTAQRALEYFEDSSEGSRLENWARATFKQEVKEAQKYYEEALAILDSTNLPHVYERPAESFQDAGEEELYRDKWKTEFRYTRDISEFSGLPLAREQHSRQRDIAEKEEELSQKNPLNHLVEAKHDYEVLIAIAENEYGLDVNEWQDVDIDTCTAIELSNEIDTGTDHDINDPGEIFEETAESPLEPDDLEDPEVFIYNTNYPQH